MTKTCCLTLKTSGWRGAERLLASSYPVSKYSVYCIKIRYIYTVYIVQISGTFIQCTLYKYPVHLYSVHCTNIRYIYTVYIVQISGTFIQCTLSKYSFICLKDKNCPFYEHKLFDHRFRITFDIDKRTMWH